jgi:hypothetical protein
MSIEPKLTTIIWIVATNHLLWFPMNRQFSDTKNVVSDHFHYTHDCTFLYNVFRQIIPFYSNYANRLLNSQQVYTNQLLFVMERSRSRSSSVSIVSWLRTGRPGYRGSIPGRGKKIFPVTSCLQTGSGAHPASCTMGTRSSLAGSKSRLGSDADHSPTTNADVKNE